MEILLQKIEQISQDLGDPRRQLILEHIALTKQLLMRTGQMFTELESLKKQVNDREQRIVEVLEWHDDAARDRDKLKAIVTAKDEQIAELQKALTDDAVAKIMLHKMALENGQFNIDLSGNIFHIFCEAFAKTFVETGATNYLEANFQSKELGEFSVMMQRKDGLTPAEKVAIAEDQIETLKAHVERLRDTAEKIRHWHDALDDGMVVSGQSVRDLWEALSATPHQSLAEHDTAVVDAFTNDVVRQILEVHEWEGAMIDVETVVRGLKLAAEQYANKIKEGDL